MRNKQSVEKGKTKKEKRKRKAKKHGKDKSKTEKDNSLDYDVDIIYQVPKVSNDQAPTGHVKKDKWEHTLNRRNGAH